MSKAPSIKVYFTPIITGTANAGKSTQVLIRVMELMKNHLDGAPVQFLTRPTDESMSELLENTQIREADFVVAHLGKLSPAFVADIVRAVALKKPIFLLVPYTNLPLLSRLKTIKYGITALPYDLSSTLFAQIRVIASSVIPHVELDLGAPMKEEQ